MSLLDKQKLQDICGHTALRARKWSGFICKRASEDATYPAEERRRRRKNAFARCVRKLALYGDVIIIHSFDCKSAVEQDGSV